MPEFEEIVSVRHVVAAARAELRRLRSVVENTQVAIETSRAAMDDALAIVRRIDSSWENLYRRHKPQRSEC